MNLTQHLKSVSDSTFSRHNPVLSSLLLDGVVAIANTTETLGYDGITYTGQTNSTDATYSGAETPASSGLFLFDRTLDTLLIGHSVWNNVGTTVDVTIQLPDLSTAVISLPDLNSYVNTGIESVDFTVDNNGSGFYLHRVTNTITVRIGTDHPDLGQDLGFGIVAIGDDAITRGYSECELNTSNVKIKSRTEITNNFEFSGMRGALLEINSNTTDAEASLSSSLESFEVGGITLGTAVGINTVSEDYIAYQTLYTHKKWGVTDHGKKYVEAFNPITGEGIILYEGSGLAGHRISHSAGRVLETSICRSLNIVENWIVLIGNNDACQYGFLNEVNAFADSMDNQTDTYREFAGGWVGVNGSGELNIMSYKTNSETQGIYEYTGTGVAGNFVETRDIYGVARRPARVIIKRVDSTGNWLMMGNKRADFANHLILNASTEEAYNATVAITAVSNGFTLSTDIDTNANGGTYLCLVEFDTNLDGGGSYFPLADLNGTDALIDVTAGSFSSVQGKDTNGNYIHGFESAIGTIPNATFTGSTDGHKWVWKENGLGYGYFDYKPKYAIYDKTSAEENAPVLVDGVWMNTIGGELVTNGKNLVDTTSWVEGGSSVLSVVSGMLRITNGATDYGSATQTLTCEIGEKYVYRLHYEHGTSPQGVYVNIFNSNVAVSVYTSTQDIYLEFTALSTSVDIKFTVANNTLGYYATVGEITCFKKQATLGTPLGKNISILPNPVMVTGDKVQYIDLNDTLIENVMDDLEVVGDANFKSDVSIEGNLSGMSGFDLGQEWVNFSTERVFDAIYENTTGRPIEMSCSATFSYLGWIQVYVTDNSGAFVRAAACQNGGAVGVELGCEGIVIPAGMKYKIIRVDANQVLTSWTELR